jgi:BirA family biotin operon repressor/biotin-[acetyl-CoA-carboxylase] ligase
MRRFDYDQLDSTNAQAKRLLEETPGEALLVTAVTQTAGRGRLGRPWQSPLGGAWFSMVWPYAVGRDAAHYGATPLVAALATYLTVRKLAGDTLRIQVKWPNDVLVNGRKAVGILCEQVIQQQKKASASSAAIIVGVGVNTNFAPADLSGDLNYPATTLRQELGHDLDVPALITDAAAHFQYLMTRYDEHGLTPPMLDALSGVLALRGEEVALIMGNGRKIGTVTGLDDHGRLLLDTPEGPFAADAGEVQSARPLAA